MTARHRANMSLKSLGCVSIDPTRLAAVFPRFGSAMNSAVNDISLSNKIKVRPLSPHEERRIKRGYSPKPLNGLAAIADIE
jgi:hypothetical protein